MVSFLRSRIGRDRQLGAAVVEYALMVALIAAVAIGALTSLGTAVDESYQGAAYQVASPEPTTTLVSTPTTLPPDDGDDGDRWCPWWAWWRNC